jgi:hypothetical protein
MMTRLRSQDGWRKKLSTIVERKEEVEAVRGSLFACGFLFVVGFRLGLGKEGSRVTQHQAKKGLIHNKKDQTSRTKEEVEEDNPNVDNRAYVKMGHSHGLRSGTRVCLSMCDLDMPTSTNLRDVCSMPSLGTSRSAVLSLCRPT